MNILSLIPSGLLKAWIQAGARHLGTALATAIGTYLLAHHATQGDVTNLQQGIVAVIVAGASIGYSMYDVKNVDTKITTALNKSIPAVPPLSETHYPEFNEIPK